MEHHVHFWLKEERQNPEDRSTFESALAGLLEIPGIQRGIWGTPAPVEPRPVLDASWDYALSLVFETVLQHDVYQIHPDHKSFIESYREWWARVEVRDIQVGS